MYEVLSVLKNTGLITTVGGPVCLYYVIANLRGKITLNLYYLVIPAQAYLLTGLYFAAFGPRIVTPRLQTLLFLVPGSLVLTTILCLVIFFMSLSERPRRLVPVDARYILMAFFVVPLCSVGAGSVLFWGLATERECGDAPRCGAYLLLNGHFGFTGALTLCVILIGVGAFVLNMACYIFLPYIPPEKNEA